MTRNVHRQIRGCAGGSVDTSRDACQERHHSCELDPGRRFSGGASHDATGGISLDAQRK